jgi:hypothetical protein
MVKNAYCKARALLLVPVVLTVFSGPSLAHFELSHASSRAMALGGAFCGFADDPSAVHYNPAGLTNSSSISFLSTYLKPYGIDDLDESSVAAVFPMKFGAAGLSWHRFTLRGVMAEDLITLGFGKDYIRTSQDASLSFGGSVDIARVSSGDRYRGSNTKVTGSLAVLLRPFPIIGIGYCVHNLVPHTFDFVSGDEGTRLERTHVWSLAYHWNNAVSIVYDRERDFGGSWNNHLGIEVTVQRGLQLRSGLNGGNVCGGAGLIVSGVIVDVGVASHEDLGASYVLSIGYRFHGDAGEDDQE